MPAISRPLLIVLVGAVVALVAFYATQGARDGGDSAAESAPTTADAEVAGSSSQGGQPDADGSAGRPASGSAERRAEADGASPTTPSGLPAPVRRALAGKTTVVLFFFRPGSAEDRATGRAVARLRGQAGVTVFSAPLGQLARYRAVVDEVGISQAPAVVIVGNGGRTRVVQGYIDPATLAQDVADIR